MGFYTYMIGQIPTTLTLWDVLISKHPTGKRFHVKCILQSNLLQNQSSLVYIGVESPMITMRYGRVSPRRTEAKVPGKPVIFWAVIGDSTVGLLKSLTSCSGKYVPSLLER